MRKKMVWFTSAFMCLVFVWSLMIVTSAQVQPTSRLIPFQGSIPGQSDGPVALRFRAFPSAQGGTYCFQETQTVTVSSEAFSAFVGDGTTGGFPAVPCFADNSSIWLAFGFETAPDQEIGDRTAITSAGFTHGAQWASNAQMANNAQSAQTAITAQRATTAQSADTLILGATMSGSRSGPILNVVNTARAGAEAGESGESADGPISASGISVTACGDGTVSVAECSPGTGVVGVNTASTGNPAYGVKGVSNSISGTGVGGFASASTGTTTGVRGVTLSNTTNATGVFGEATRPTGIIYGVYGKSNSTSGIGVRGDASAGTGPTLGVSGVSNSPLGVGVQGVAYAGSGDTTGVNGIANASPAGVGVRGDGQRFGVYGFSNLGRGVFGAVSSGAGVHGTAGYPSFFTPPSGVGVLGHSNNGTGVYGLSASGSPITDAGVYGRSNAANGAGVLGEANNGPAAYGVWGKSTTGSGVVAETAAADQYAMQALSPLSTSKGLFVRGRLVVQGRKSGAVKLETGQGVLLYALETPEPMFEDLGSARLENGVTRVPIEPMFAKTINTKEEEYLVFLTPEGPNMSLYVSNKTADSFEVRSIDGPDVKFNWRVVAKQKGSEKIRLEQIELPELNR